MFDDAGRWVRASALQAPQEGSAGRAYRVLFRYFAAHPCVDCGENDPIVLEFDHLDGATKSFDIGAGLTYRAWDSILAEIDKCEDVCANCHRRRTAQRRGSFRAQLAEQARRLLKASGRGESNPHRD